MRLSYPLTSQAEVAYLNRLTQVSSVPSAGSTLSYAYQYNNANQRTSATTADGSYWNYAYDTLGQVASGNKYWSEGTPVAGQQFTYAFDSIGNRRTVSFGGDQNGANLHAAVYSPNSLNEYASRTVPGYVQALGLANSNATVTLWGSDGSYSPTTRKGQYFRGELGVNNANALWLTVTNLGVLKNGLNPDILTNSVGNVFVPPSSESFVYDWDGNLTQDGRWQYTWDAENRLVSMQGLAGIPTAAKLKLDFTYDAQGRRVQKVVSTNNGSIYGAQYTNLFAYDGWSLVAQLNTPSSLIRSYAWGLDLSGSPQGAGGVGGLLAINDPSNGEQFPAFDGNGNLIGLIKGADGTASANYEYGPFGEVIRATGSMAKANPIRFSTKYQDDETDLLDYGYRFYSSATGNWLSRDPAGERGGANVYAFAARNPVSKHDARGLLADETAIGNCSCQCLSVAVTYQPGGNHLELEAYRYGLSVMFGNRVHVSCSVWGNPRRCRYYQDEGNAWARVDGISPVVPNVSKFVGVNGNVWQREYTDPMGVDTDWLWPGEFKFTVHWDVVFRCVSSDGTAVTKHDEFPDATKNFTLAP